MINCILIGPQGSGKGTQAEMIINIYGLVHIETGLIIRNRSQIHDKKADLMNHLANKKGMLLPDGIVLDMILDEMTEKRSEKGYLFDGYPRTLNQHESLKEILNQKSQKITVSLYLNIPDHEAIKRISLRRICQKCNKSYGGSISPDKNLCSCGGLLVRRTDDAPEAVVKRLELFHRNTQPILGIMQKDGNLVEIDGNKNIENISTDIRNILDKFITN